MIFGFGRLGIEGPISRSFHAMAWYGMEGAERKTQQLLIHMPDPFPATTEPCVLL